MLTAAPMLTGDDTVVDALERCKSMSFATSEGISALVMVIEAIS
jgi:hypothetical protein